MKPSRLAFLFPGQGAQQVGMGQELFRSASKSRGVFLQADEALGFSLSDLCFQGPEDQLRLTHNAQPAILTTSVACLAALEEAGLEPAHLAPRFVAGHSLGEYTALVAAGALDFPDAVRLVRERGRLMYEAGLQQPGGMVAVLGLDETTLEQICQETGTQMANINSQDQIVVSGAKEALARTMDLAKTRGARRTIPLDVSGAFHSSLMEPAVKGMEQALSQIKFHKPRVTVVANTTGQPLTSADAIKEELLRQLCRAVRWYTSMQYMISAGVSTFLEIGPGQVLAGLAKRMSDGLVVMNVNSMQSIAIMKATS